VIAAVLALLLSVEDATSAAANRCTSFDLGLAGLGSRIEDLARVAGLAGTAPLRPVVLRRPSGARPVWLCDGEAPAPESIGDPQPLPTVQWDVVPPTGLATVHTGWADDRNDGALFGGRGLSASVSTGVRVRWRWLTAQVAPLLGWQQNAGYFLPRSSGAGESPYANPFDGSIDLPLRMGPGPFSTVDWGSSSVRAEALGFAVGLSNENLWWGPGIKNSLLMSNSAAGFPHVFLGTARPKDVYVGFLEAELMWGSLRSSPYFSGAPSPRRLFESLVLSFEPAIARGLTLGFARVFVFPTDDVPFRHYLDVVVQSPYKMDLLSPSNPSGDSTDNQLVSVFFRWAMPGAAFEFYGEWGRDDHAWNWRDFIQEPGHAQALLLGFQKLLPVGRRWLRIQAEATHTFEMPPANITRGTPIFYTHYLERQGYTQGGQMIGAGLGPQGDTQFLAVDWLLGPGHLGLFGERVLRHERWFRDNLAGTPGATHDAAFTFGARGAWSTREWDLAGDAGWTHRYALDFGPPAGALDARLSATWWPGRVEAPLLPARR
jgi:hypothetical protein